MAVTVALPASQFKQEQCLSQGAARTLYKTRGGPWSGLQPGQGGKVCIAVQSKEPPATQPCLGWFGLGSGAYASPESWTGSVPTPSQVCHLLTPALSSRKPKKTGALRHPTPSLNGAGGTLASLQTPKVALAFRGPRPSSQPGSLVHTALRLGWENKFPCPTDAGARPSQRRKHLLRGGSHPYRKG